MTSATLVPPLAEVTPADVPPRRRPAVSGGADIIGLPTGTSRLLAATSAVGAAVVTAWLCGSPAVTSDTAALCVGSALSLVIAVRLGLRGKAIAVLTGPFLIISAFVIVFELTSSLTWVIGLIGAMTVAVPVVRLQPFRKIAAIGAIAMTTAVLWSLPGVLALGYLLVGSGGESGIFIGAAVGLMTWTWSRIERGVRMSSRTLISASRDGLYVTVTLLTASIAALWLGATAESAISRAASETALESVSPAAGWLTAIGAFALLGWSAVRLPRWLAAAQLRGRIEARVTTESQVFVVLTCLNVLLAGVFDRDVLFGRACVVALVAAGTYVAARARYAVPLPLPDHPLWILAPADTAGVRSGVAGAAADWQAGQVTILAVPSLARRLGGRHLYAALSAGEGLSLFPTRPIHLQDWVEAQRGAWPSLPVRELYAPIELWPRILAENADDRSRVLVLDHAYGRQVGGLLTTPANAAAALRTEAAAERLWDSTSRTAVGRAAVTALVRRNCPPESAVRVRHIVLQAAAPDAALASEVARRVHGATDDRGRIVECWVPSNEQAGDTVRRLLGLPGGVWRHAMLFTLRLFGSTGNLPVQMRLYTWLVERVFRVGWNGDFEVVVLERGNGDVLPLPMLDNAVAARDVEPVIALRLSGELGTLTYRPDTYGGQITLPSGRPREVVVGYVAQKLLANDVGELVASRASEVLSSGVWSDEPRLAGSTRTPWLWAAGAIVLLAAWWAYFGSERPRVVEPAVKSAITEAYEKRMAGDVQGAVSTLTTALGTERDETVRLQLLLDRAYGYKLLRQWPDSIQDLTAALEISERIGDRTLTARVANRSGILADRAFAYLQTRDIDASVADAAAIGGNSAARDLVTRTRPGYLFVYLPASNVNGPAFLPDAVTSLGRPWTNVNLRFWWYPIEHNEVRYTDANDAAEADALRTALRRRGLETEAPVLMPKTLPRPRRIEVWLTTRKELPATPSRSTAAPASTAPRRDASKDDAPSGAFGRPGTFSSSIASLFSRLATATFERNDFATPRFTYPAAVDDLTRRLQASRTGQLAVVGHASADEGASSEERLSLSRARAKTVEEVLVRKLGIAQYNGLSPRIVVRGEGDTSPLCKDATEECYARNRRVELVLVPEPPVAVPAPPVTIN